MHIVIFHPDLGVGGAERLLVDSAIGLQQKGHKVIVFTSHHSPSHCFEETKNTLNVCVYGDFLPITILGYFYILFAHLRHLWLVFAFIYRFYFKNEKCDIIYMDQISSGLPILRLFLSKRIPFVFYCHFPDKLLVQGRNVSLLKRIYRWPMNRIEEWSMSFSDEIFVNSQFTANTYKEHFPYLVKRNMLPKVLYPGIILDNYSTISEEHVPSLNAQETTVAHFLKGKKTIISLNRYEKKKSIDLSIYGFHQFIHQMSKGPRTREFCLVIAGGYDPRVVENKAYYDYLYDLSSQTLGLVSYSCFESTLKKIPEDTQVLFLTSITSPFRNYLLHIAEILIYTPSNEHFGLVPIEAMACGHALVVGINSGGPKETIIHEKTGFLVDNNGKDIGNQFYHILYEMNIKKLNMIRAAARKRVEENFTIDKFIHTLEQTFLNLQKKT